MISTIFGAIGDVITAFITDLTSAFSGVATLFVTESSGTYTLTFLGTLMICAIGAGIIIWAFSMIRAVVRNVAGTGN